MPPSMQRGPRISVLKQLAFAVATGILVAIMTIGAGVLASNDLRVIFGVGLIAAGAAAFALARYGRPPWMVGLVWLPVVCAYVLAVLPEIPASWPTPLLWAVSGVLGAMIAAAGRARLIALVAFVAVFALATEYVRSGIPMAITRSLTHYVDTAAPGFAFVTLDGRLVTRESLKGKTVVVDFFGTWCVPCRAELPELAKVRDQFASQADVVLVVVANESGGDTPDKVRAFASQHGLGLTFALDQGGTSHQQFGFTGVPALVVLGPAGRLRLRREGYNTAETELASVLGDLIRTVRRDTARS